MKERISPSYSLTASRDSPPTAFRSIDCDLLRAEPRREGLSGREGRGFSEMEAFLGRRGSRLVMSLPKTRLGGTCRRRSYITYETKINC
jgi:hypothetical protein